MTKSKRGKNKNYKPRPVHGLYARNFPAPLRWKIDQDYIGQLSDEEQAWLSDFQDAYYGSDFRRTDLDEWPLEARRAAYADKRVARIDRYGISQSSELLAFLDDLSRPPSLGPVDLDDEYAQDLIPTPDYLSSPEYKQALAEYRALLSPSRQNRAPPPTTTPEQLERARRKLEKARHGKPEDPDDDE